MVMNRAIHTMIGQLYLHTVGQLLSTVWNFGSHDRSFALILHCFEIESNTQKPMQSLLIFGAGKEIAKGKCHCSNLSVCRQHVHLKVEKWNAPLNKAQTRLLGGPPTSLPTPLLPSHPAELDPAPVEDYFK